VLRRGGEEAELTCSIASPQLVIVDHTGVPDSLRGSGAGQRLVADACVEGFRL